jgi:hypothetical protein
MFRIDDSSASATLPVPEAAATEGYWTEGNPATGVPATLERASWFNMVQEELRAIVVAGGLTPSKTVYNQILQSINVITQNAGPIVSAAGGTADALTGAYTPAIIALANGMTLYVRAGFANATTAPTFKADGTALKTIVKGNNLPLSAGDIAGAGHWIELQYDLALDKWVLLNPSVATAANDATGADNSTRIATTGWVRNAMAAIATAAGFAASFTSNGYIKLPSWLGGFIAQWGLSGQTATSIAVSYPISFPNTIFWMGIQDNSGQPNLSIWSYTLVGLTGFTAYNIAVLTKGNAAVLASNNSSCPFFAVGR